MIDTNAIKANSDLLAIVEGDLGPPAKRSGRVSHWRCPFHDDQKTPSLAVYPDGGFHCFGCGISGDVIDWHMQYHKEDFPTACQALAGGDVPTSDRPPPRPAVKLPVPPPNEWQTRAAGFMVECHKALWDNAEALDWLERTRGISRETVDHWGLGVNDRHQQQRWGIGESGKVSIDRGVVLPYWQRTDDTIWGLQVWRGPKKDPKYRKVSGSRASLFGAHTLAGQDTAFVTEGEFDCMLLWQSLGDRAGVCTFGSATTHEIEGWLPYLLPVKQLLICTDADAAGEEAWEYWQSKTKRAKRLLPPGGAKDVTDAWREGQDLARWVEEVFVQGTGRETK